MKCPCRDCNNRTVTCHGFCEQYKEWKTWRDGLNVKVKKERERYDTMSDKGIRWIYKEIVKRSRRK